jgi:hypothetical protein
MTRQARKYATAYKKKVDIERDTYQPKKSPQGIRQCRGCGAFYYLQRWSLEPPAEMKAPPRAQTKLKPVLCPACLKIRDQYPLGELRLSAIEAQERPEVMRILRNEESRAREKNPLERIMTIEATDQRGWTVKTTTEKLAQRLGRCLRKSRGGSVRYQWSHNNKFVHVIWSKAKEQTS